MKTLSVIGLALLLVMGGLTLNSPSYADTIAYDVAVGTGSNQIWTGSLGMDFNTNQAITVTQLGTFDSLGNGFAAGTTITVAIFDRDTSTQVGTSLTFTNADPGNLVNGNRFKSLSTAINLPAGGHYSIVAWGYNANDGNYNTGFVGPINTTSTENSGGGLISFVGTARYNNLLVTGYPTIVDGGPTNRYDAGTFQYVPIPPSALLLGSGLMGLGILGWRRRRS